MTAERVSDDIADSGDESAWPGAQGRCVSRRAAQCEPGDPSSRCHTADPRDRPTRLWLVHSGIGVQTYLAAVSQLGLIVFLVRHGGAITDAEFDQAFTLLGAIGVSVAAIVYVALPIVEQWIGIEAFAPVGRALVVALPIQLLAMVPMGRLERALNYRAIAPVELGGYLVFYAVALPLAHSGMREWAPVAGFWTQQTLVAIGLYSVAAIGPSLRWDPRRIREMLGYGVRYSGALWIWQLRDIVNPIIVGRFGGPQPWRWSRSPSGSSTRSASSRESAGGSPLSVLGRLQKEPVRMVRAASEGMRLQVVGARRRAGRVRPHLTVGRSRASSERNG